MDVDEMVRGYLAGYNSGSSRLPECHSEQPPAYKHGWLNGRDDRQGQPRDRASVLRSRAGMILAEAG